MPLSMLVWPCSQRGKQSCSASPVLGLLVFADVFIVFGVVNDVVNGDSALVGFGYHFAVAE